MQRSYFEFDADTAAEFAGSAAIGAQSVALVKQRIVQFLQFYRRVLHVTLAHGNRRGRAVLKGTATPTTTDDVLAHIAPASFWLSAEDRVTAHVSLVCRRDALRQHRRQRAEDRVQNRRQ